MDILPLELDGVFEIRPNIFEDIRGQFVKVFHQADFLKAGLDFHLAEQYYSTSKKNVIRGMHFQLPPNDHKKMVYCISGAVLDVILDLRKDSPSFGESCSLILDEKLGNGIYIPEGFAHGFCSLEENSCMVYNVSTVYAPESDTGILYDSFGFKWNVDNPIVNTRDSKFPKLVEVISPF